MEKLLFVYIFIISVVTVILTVYDKRAAKNGRFRISEATLILCGIFGGALAELVTMLIIRHKTRHIKFMLGLPSIIIAQLIIFVVFKILTGMFYA